MSREFLFFIATCPGQAAEIVGRLRTAGFSKRGISVLPPYQGVTRNFAHGKSTKAPEGAVIGAGTGGCIGGALGWLAGSGALAFPGVGPFAAPGTIIAALSGAVVVAVVAALAGGLIGWAIPGPGARRYEGRIQDGEILMSVLTGSSDEAARVKVIFQEAGARDLSASRAVAAKNRTASAHGPWLAPDLELELEHGHNQDPSSMLGWD